MKLAFKLNPVFAFTMVSMMTETLILTLALICTVVLFMTCESVAFYFSPGSDLGELYNCLYNDYKLGAWSNPHYKI